MTKRSTSATKRPRTRALEETLRARAARVEKLNAVLKKMSKDQLVELLHTFAEKEPSIADDILLNHDDEATEVELVAAVRDAIRTATLVPKHLINHNFPFDYAAYGRIEKGLRKLLSLGRTDDAMNLAIEVMKNGSYQIEMSDEGMMLDEVADCIRVVYKGLTKSGVDEATQEEWRAQLAEADRVGFVLEAVRKGK